MVTEEILPEPIANLLVNLQSNRGGQQQIPGNPDGFDPTLMIVGSELRSKPAHQVSAPSARIRGFSVVGWRIPIAQRTS